MTARDAGAIAARTLAIVSLLNGIRTIIGTMQLLPLQDQASKPYLITSASIGLVGVFGAWVLWATSTRFYIPSQEEESAHSSMGANTLFRLSLAVLGAYFTVTSISNLATDVILSGGREIVSKVTGAKAGVLNSLITLIIGVALLAMNRPMTRLTPSNNAQ